MYFPPAFGNVTTYVILVYRQKAQLCETLGRRVLVLAPGRPELSIPVTATVWAAAVRHATAADCDPEASGAPSSRRGGGGGRGPVPGSLRGGWSGLDESCFDMVLGHVAVDDVAGDMALDEGSLDPGDRRPCDRECGRGEAWSVHVDAGSSLVFAGGGCREGRVRWVRTARAGGVGPAVAQVVSERAAQAQDRGTCTGGRVPRVSPHVVTCAATSITSACRAPYAPQARRRRL